MNRIFILPLAVAATSSLLIAPITIPPSTPHALAVELVSASESVVKNANTESSSAVTAAAVQLSAAGLLARTPALLRTVSVHDLAGFVALPEATTPLRPATQTPGGGNDVARVAASSSTLAVAGTPGADLLSALQAIVGRFGDALGAAPANVLKSVGQLLGGDLRGSLQTLTNILIQPIVLVGLLDLPNVAAPLAKLAPAFAPVINAFPDLAINVSVAALQVIIDAREGVADTFEGVRGGLQNGDLGAAINAFVAGVGALAQKGFTGIFGANGLISELGASGGKLLQAIRQIGAPTPTTRAADAKAVETKVTSTITDAAETDTPAPTGSAKTVGSITSSPSTTDSTDTSTPADDTPGAEAAHVATTPRQESGDRSDEKEAKKASTESVADSKAGEDFKPDTASKPAATDKSTATSTPAGTAKSTTAGSASGSGSADHGGAESKAGAED